MQNRNLPARIPTTKIPENAITHLDFLHAAQIKRCKIGAEKNSQMQSQASMHLLNSKFFIENGKSRDSDILSKSRLF